MNALPIKDDPIAEALMDWIPWRLTLENANQLVKWIYLGDKNFTEPFFEDTIRKCRQFMQNRNKLHSLSSLDILPEWAAHYQELTAAAVIFHVSRCGSTTISQMLSIHKSSIVLSEVPLFDELLRAGLRQQSADRYLQELKAAIRLTARPRSASQDSLFIKTDSWHIHFYSQYRSLFPGTPFVLLYRRPDEVLRSQQKNRGMHAVPGLLEPGIFGIDPATIIYNDLDLYIARVLESYYSTLITIRKKDTNTILVNYNEGMQRIAGKITARSGIQITSEEQNRMNDRLQYHGKYPEQVFEKTVATESIPFFLRKAYDIYEELDALNV